MKNDMDDNEARADYVANHCVGVDVDDDGVDGDADADDPLCLAHLACGLATPRFLCSFFLLFCWLVFFLFCLVGLFVCWFVCLRSNWVEGRLPPWSSPVYAP